MLKSTQWLSSSNSVSMVALTSQAHGLPRAPESTSRVARKLAASSWISASAHVSSKESFATTRLGMDLLALSTRSLQRVASQLLVALAPSTLTMDQMSQSFKTLTDNFLSKDLPHVMPAL